ncbi:MAG: starch-binding protein [Bacteroidetes bacterium GWF2_42_66]|nr:MAG: starch-binding protein [Bacteroidetes bacterium GWA2_42_15]OFY00193.1 MAG: starch-binding protein [Bacteroidetes bacterium GWE2_42_39]OFY40334.1 MAG: starch-binding protein [Bacteroidetes bacterium GWF2_42_66]HBL73679.1 RagB/SusD family nutrient uptake outer membrane protein [Prolixibacteraceae bacterium]HCR90689.1 RagB/SusD family nutrient uptake outer membrane protein [Prolixibacteraceae bacterium]
MKNKIIFLLIGIIFFSCNSLDLNPLSEASSENWYTNKEGIEMAINHLYNNGFWNTNDYDDKLSNITQDKAEWTDSWTDDWTCRTNLSVIAGGTINSQADIVNRQWNIAYVCIANANIILSKLEDLSSEINEETLKKYCALARFARAYQYSKLIFFFGDVPFYTKELTIEESLNLSRTTKKSVLDSIYSDYNYAASILPVSYGSSDLKYMTKGAVLGFKARIALYMGDWTVARDAAKACMDLGVYQLLPSFWDVTSKKNSIETIFAVPRSAALGYCMSTRRTSQAMTRNAGHTDYVQPSWQLLCSFLCTDGLPIDESPLYNPHNPFRNRDPRCTATIVEFGTRHLGYKYEPHPDSLTTLNYLTGAYVKNKESKGSDQYATFNGLMWKKGITEGGWSNSLLVDVDDIVLRYADVLLMYAEAKIELGEINQSVLDAMNQVRTRAYNNTGIQYPVITVTDQSKLRKIVRLERRMEFAFEARRYYDIIRWKQAEKVLNQPIYGLLDVAALRNNVVKPGLWFFPGIPPIDEDGVADFSAMYNAGLIKLLAIQKFDSSKQYLWPIPSTEIKVNSNMTQNPGY